MQAERPAGVRITARPASVAHRREGPRGGHARAQAPLQLGGAPVPALPTVGAHGRLPAARPTARPGQLLPEGGLAAQLERVQCLHPGLHQSGSPETSPIRIRLCDSFVYLF